MSVADYCRLVSIRLLGLTENFFDEIKSLPLDEGNDEMSSFSNARDGRGGMRGHKKRKVHHLI